MRLIMLIAGLAFVGFGFITSIVLLLIMEIEGSTNLSFFRK